MRASAIQTPPLPVTEIVPIYDVTNLVMVLHKALQNFHESWNARLGFPSAANLEREPWQRIKALTKRLGVSGDVEYNSLKPVADLNKFLSEAILGFISDPVRWDPVGEHSEELRVAKLGEIIRQLAERLRTLSIQRLVSERGLDWSEAFYLRGIGSTKPRAQKVRAIYDLGAPVPAAKADQQTTEFMGHLKLILREAIEGAGGKLS